MHIQVLVGHKLMIILKCHIFKVIKNGLFLKVELIELLLLVLLVGQITRETIIVTELEVKVLCYRVISPYNEEKL